MPMRGKRIASLSAAFGGFGLLAACNAGTEVDIGDGTQLIYSVRWGWGMEQSIGIAHKGRIAAEASAEVWKRPYWAGGPLYKTRDGARYYIAFRFSLYEIDVSRQVIKQICSVEDDVAMKLEYVGQFSLTELKRGTRGDDVTFTPAGQTPPEESGASSGIGSLKGRCG
jgi:hypothetical protein